MATATTAPATSPPHPRGTQCSTPPVSRPAPTVTGVTSTYTYAGTNQNEVLSEAIPNDHTYHLTYGRPDKNGLPEVDSVNVAGLGVGYVLSDPSGQPVMLSTSTGNTLLYLYDGIHNPVGLSTSSETTATTFQYDPYGGVTTTRSFSTSYENPYTFGEGLLDRATHEVKFGQRFYNPTTGNWTQQDALNAPLDPANANRYTYAASNPINNNDPTGRGSLCEFGIATIGVIISAVGTFIPIPGLDVAAFGLGLTVTASDVSGGCDLPPNNDYGVSEYGYGY